MTNCQDLEPIIRQAMANLPWDTAGVTVNTNDIFAPIAEECHVHGTVIRADVSRALASVYDRMGFELHRLGGLDEELQACWDRIAHRISNQVGKELVTDLFENQDMVLLVEE